MFSNNFRNNIQKKNINESDRKIDHTKNAQFVVYILNDINVLKLKYLLIIFLLISL